MENNKYNLTLERTHNSEILVKTVKIVSLMTSKELNFTLYGSPFGNCQSFSISNFERIVDFTNKNSIDLASILKDLKVKVIGKSLLVVDVYKTVFDKIKNNLKIHSYSNYINFTNSNMVIVLIDLRG